VIGSDLNSESTGIEYRVIKAARKNDAKLVIANVRSVKLKKLANSFLQYKPGGEVALLVALSKALIEAGCRPAGAESFAASLAALSMADLAAACGVAEKTIRDAAALLAGSKATAVIFGADIIRSASPKEAVTAVANIALLLGALGKDSGGVFPVDEKNNTLGMLEMSSVPGEGGLDINGIVAGIENGSVKALYIAGANPLATFPDNRRIKKAFEKLELLIVQDILTSELTKMAHLVLPASAAAERHLYNP